MNRYEMIEAHGLYASSEGGVKERIRWVVAERTEAGKPLRELCSCSDKEVAARIIFALLCWDGEILELTRTEPCTE